MKKYYDMMTQTPWAWIVGLYVFLGIFLLIAIWPSEPQPSKTIIQLEIDIKEIDKTLTSIEETIDEIIGKLEIKVNAGEQ